MTKQLINFNYPWLNYADDRPRYLEGADLNEWRFVDHLRALLRGHGSSTENIVIAFAKDLPMAVAHHRKEPEDWSHIDSAWNRLDDGQKYYVGVLRELAGRALLDVNKDDFVDQWIASLVERSASQMMESDDLPIEEQAILCKNAHEAIRLTLNLTEEQMPDTFFVVDQVDNDE